jgi:hypothetical protein
MYLSIDRDSSLWQLLTSFLDAYNRRTDIMEQTSEAAFQSRIDALTQDMNASTTTVEEAINQDKGEQ